MAKIIFATLVLVLCYGMIDRPELSRLRFSRSQSVLVCLFPEARALFAHLLPLFFALPFFLCARSEHCSCRMERRRVLCRKMRR